VTTPLELSVRLDADGTAVLRAAGEIDMSNADAFGRALREAGAAGPADFVLDLSEVDYLDSAGLTALLRHASRIKITASALLAPVLAVSGLAKVTTVVPAR
jgi:anti-sigma B factor antagonist